MNEWYNKQVNTQQTNIFLLSNKTNIQKKLNITIIIITSYNQIT